MLHKNLIPRAPEKAARLPSFYKDLLCLFILLVVTLAAYQPALNGGILWDDEAHLTRPELRTLHGLGRIWTEPKAIQQYYPLVHSLFWLEYHLWGGSTFGYHLINILLHLLSALLLLKILRRLKVPAAWFIAALFALHPVQVESVAWITELKNTLSGVFFFGAALSYLAFDSERSKRYYWTALALFILGLLSKSVIATMPVSLLAIFWWKRGKIQWKQDVIPLLPFFVFGMVSGLFTALIEQHVHGARGSEFGFTIIERCLIAGRAIWFYLGTIVFPVNLTFIYPRWHMSQAVWWQYLFPLAALGLAAFLWVLRNRSRAPFAVFVCFTAALFPVLGFFNVYPFRFSFVADHFQYLALPGPLALAAAGIHRGLDFMKGSGQWFLKSALYGIILLTLSAVTWNQCRTYTDAETLYRSIIRKNPLCWMAHTNLGILLANGGKTDEAMDHCLKAVQLDSTLSECHNNLGLLLANSGSIEEAIDHFRKALEIDSQDVEAQNNLGNALFYTGRTDEAAACFREALEINPYHEGARNNLGNILMQKGRTEEAIICYRKVLEIDPGYVQAHNNLGMALQRTDHMEDAASEYRIALELYPDYVEAHCNLGILLSETGRLDESASHFWRALQLNPDNLRAINNRIGALLKKERQHDAVLLLQKLNDLAEDSGNKQLANTVAAYIGEISRIVNKQPEKAVKHK